MGKKDKRKKDKKAKVAKPAETMADVRPQGQSLRGVLANMVKPVHLKDSFRPEDYGLLANKVGNVVLAHGDSHALRPDEAASIVKAIKEELDPDMTEEQRAVSQASKDAARLMAKEEYRRLSGAMIAFRQSYAVAYRELQRLMEKEEGLHPMTEDVIIGAAMYEASKPFDENRLMQGVVDVVLPWLADVVDTHIEVEAGEQLKAKIEAEEARKARPVPIGLKHTQEQDAPGLDRDRPLVLVGWGKALLWLIDQICNNVLIAKEGQLYTVIRFMETPPKSADQHRRLIRLGRSAWAGCADSQNALARCMGEYVADKLSYQPDLLIADNLAPCYTKGFIGRPDAASAGDANKTLSKWCKQAGAALIGCVPTETPEVPDIRGGEFEQLRTFTNLRAVTLADAGDDSMYRIVVGNQAAVFDVPKDTINGYGTGGIILPPGVVG